MIYVQTRAFDYHARGADPRRRVVTTLEEFQWMMAVLVCQTVVAYDTETSGTAWYKHARICGYSFTCRMPDGGLMSWYVPIRHATGELQLPADLALAGLKSILEDPRIQTVMHNAKFDWHMTRADGIDIVGPRRDTMIEASLADENAPLALKSRAAVDLNRPEAFVYESILNNAVARLAKEARIGIKEYKARFGYSHVPVHLAGIYACYDTEFTYELAELYDRTGITSAFASTYQRELDLTEVLMEMEENGLPVDVDYIGHLKEVTEEAQENIEPQIFSSLNDYSFNLASDPELLDVLQNRLGLRLWKTTRTGAFSTDKEVLEELEDEHPAIPLIMQWRQANKISTTYTDSILASIGYDGLLHGDFRQVGTNTGRLSSGNPNLQNFAGDSNARALDHTGLSLEDGGIDPWSVKRAFVNRGAEWVRGFYDYSQIELRVLAYYSQDPTMLDVYLNNGDIHERTRMEVFGEGGKRRDAKVINFGLSYCLSPGGFARQAKIPREDAEEFMSTFFQRYPRIAPFRQEFWQHVRQNNGFFQNIFGRPRRIPSINTPDAWARGRAERQAIGTLIQGTAAELTKISLIRLHRWNREQGLGLKICTTIHDEIQIDQPRHNFMEVARGVKHTMQDFQNFGALEATTDVEWMDTTWADKQGVAV